MVEWTIELGVPVWDSDFHSAAKYGHVAMLEWATRVRGVRLDQSSMATAIRAGKLEVAKWLAQQTGLRHTVTAEDVLRELWTARDPLVSWALKNLKVKYKKELAEGIDCVAGRGDLELVKVLHENAKGESCTTTAMDEAARFGYLEILKWLHENRSEGCTTRAMDAAAKYGHLHVAQWLHENRSEGCMTNAMDGAAVHNHLGIVKWLHMHRNEGCTTRALDAAAQQGNLEVVKWLHANRSEGRTEKAMDGATMNGRLDIVQWFHDNRDEECTTRAMDMTATRGHLEVVQWLHGNRSEGCTSEAMISAARTGRLHVIQWLAANRIAQATVEALISAVQGGWMNVVEWMLPRLADEEFRVNAMEHAIWKGGLEMALVLHAHGKLLCDSNCFRRVLKHGKWQFFQWLVREFPDAMLTPSELEAVTMQSVANSEALRAYRQDAIYEYEQLLEG